MNVRDIMRTAVVTAHPDQTVRELTRLLSEHGISGGPVVDDGGAVLGGVSSSASPLRARDLRGARGRRRGAVLGVVSSSDVIRVAAGSDSVPLAALPWVNPSVPENTVDPEDPPPDPYSDYFLPEEAPVVAPDWDAGDRDGPLDQLSVADIMTPVTFNIDGDATLAELADFLVRGRIHRAIVLDQGRLAGIVTAVDVLRAVAEGNG